VIAWDQMVATDASWPEDLQVRLVTCLERGLESIDDEWLARMEAALLSRPAMRIFSISQAWPV